MDPFGLASVEATGRVACPDSADAQIMPTRVARIYPTRFHIQHIFGCLSAYPLSEALTCQIRTCVLYWQESMF